MPWHGGVRNIILLHTHIILSQHFTNNFSLHITLYSHATPSWTENDLHLLSFVPVYQHALSFPVCFSRWGIENFCIVFPYSVKERVKQEYFSGCLKMHDMPTLYRSVCLFLFIKLQLELQAQCCLQTQLLTISNKLWENHDLALQLVITYIYLCERISASCFSFSNRHSVMDQKLNWNVTRALEKPFTIGILS